MFGRQRQRGLTEQIAPAIRRPDVSVAEPKHSIKWLVVDSALQKQLGRDDRGIAGDPDGLCTGFFILKFPDKVVFSRPGEQFIAVDLPSIATSRLNRG